MSDERIKRNLAFAKKASEFSDFHQHQLGCAIVYGKSVIGVGWNCLATHPRQMEYNRYRKLWGTNIKHRCHAEVRAIESVKHFNINWKKVTLYIYREYKNGVPALSRPCPACMQLIKNMGVRKIVYTDDNEFGFTIENVC
jgi:deoxycytidylate deaminase